MNEVGKRILLDALRSTARAYAYMNAADELAWRRTKDHVQAVAEACKQAGCTTREIREAAADYVLLCL